MGFCVPVRQSYDGEMSRTYKQHLHCLLPQVLDGYVYLGNTATLNEETMNAFANVVGTAAHKVIRGVILTRQGLESKARNTSMVQDLVKLLPPDLFRTCLARVRTSYSNQKHTVIKSTQCIMLKPCRVRSSAVQCVAALVLCMKRKINKTRTEVCWQEWTSLIFSQMCILMVFMQLLMITSFFRLAHDLLAG